MHIINVRRQYISLSFSLLSLCLSHFNRIYRVIYSKLYAIQSKL